MSDTERKQCAGCKEPMTSDVDFNICEGCDEYFCYACEKSFISIPVNEIDPTEEFDEYDDDCYVRYCNKCATN